MDENLNGLALSLIYFIDEIYKIISDDINGIIRIKQDFLAYKKKKDLASLFHDYKKTGNRQKRMNVDERYKKIDELDVNSELLNIVYDVLDKYVLKGKNS
jgi:hypothetical protein